METDNFDIKNIWQQLKVEEPGTDELLRKAKNYKRRSISKLIIGNVLLLLTSVFIIWIWVIYQPQFIATKIGIVLIILAMAGFIVIKNKLFSYFAKVDDVQATERYLQHLLELKARQKFIQTTVMSAYFLMLTAGLCLYMIEYTSRMSMQGAVLAYALVLVWIAFNWFYTRPRLMKKQEAEIDELINKIEILVAQFDEKEPSRGGDEKKK